jgi:hypothetical protein
MNAMKRGVLIAVTLFMTFASLAWAQGAFEAREVKLDAVTGTGSKVCSVFVPNNWRDSLSVPATFTRAACMEFGRNEGATHYQLACTFNNGVGFNRPAGLGDTSTPAPPQNCGWN